MSSPERNLPYFQRACLLVSNLDKALLVYRDLLGFQLGYQSVDTPDSYSYEIFRIPGNIGTQFATLSSEDQLRTLALIEVPDSAWFGDQPRLASTVIQVRSVAQTLEKANTLGLASTKPRTELAPNNGLGRVEAAIYDYDQHPVVIYEILE